MWDDDILSYLEDANYLLEYWIKIIYFYRITEIFLSIYKEIFSKCVVVLAKVEELLHLDLLYTFTNMKAKKIFSKLDKNFLQLWSLFRFIMEIRNFWEKIFLLSRNPSFSPKMIHLKTSAIFKLSYLKRLVIYTICMYGKKDITFLAT